MCYCCLFYEHRDSRSNTQRTFETNILTFPLCGTMNCFWIVDSKEIGVILFIIQEPTDKH